MSYMVQTARRIVKSPERFGNVQPDYHEGKYHGWVDQWDRDFDGKAKEPFFESDKGNTSLCGYEEDGFVVEDSFVEDSDQTSFNEGDIVLYEGYVKCRIKKIMDVNKLDNKKKRGRPGKQYNLVSINSQRKTRNIWTTGDKLSYCDVESEESYEDSYEDSHEESYEESLESSQEESDEESEEESHSSDSDDHDELDSDDSDYFPSDNDLSEDEEDQDMDEMYDDLNKLMKKIKSMSSKNKSKVKTILKSIANGL